VLRALCYRALMGCNMSESAVFRAVEKWKPVAILDETEIYTREGKSAVQNLLNSGYRRNQFAIRVRTVNEGVPVLDLFDVFGFKALAGTEGFKAALESRSIMINMGKNVRKVKFLMDEEKARELRNRLLLWRWRKLIDVSDVSDAFLKDIPRLLGFTDGRVMELFSCLVAVTNHGRDNIISYARDVHQERLDEEEASVEAEISGVIAKCGLYVAQGRFPTSKVKELFNLNRIDNEKWKTTSIGRVVKRLGFKKTRMPDSSRGFVWNQRLVDKLVKRYHIPLEETSEVSETSSEAKTQQRFYSPLATEQIEEITIILSGGDGMTVSELEEKTGIPQPRLDKVLSLMERDGAAYRPKPDYWKISR